MACSLCPLRDILCLPARPACKLALRCFSTRTASCSPLECLSPTSSKRKAKAHHAIACHTSSVRAVLRLLRRASRPHYALPCHYYCSSYAGAWTSHHGYATSPARDHPVHILYSLTNSVPCGRRDESADAHCAGNNRPDPDRVRAAMDPSSPIVDAQSRLDASRLVLPAWIQGV